MTGVAAASTHAKSAVRQVARTPSTAAIPATVTAPNPAAPAPPPVAPTPVQAPPVVVSGGS